MARLILDLDGTLPPRPQNYPITRPPRAAFRVYADPAQMLAHLHEIGVMTEATWNGNATAMKT